ncbi:DNA topoisomerase [Methanopyrus sp.]
MASSSKETMVIIAEKPSLAGTIAGFLRGRWNGRKLLGFGKYRGRRFAITSLSGHVLEWWPKDDPGFRHPDYFPDPDDFELRPIDGKERFLRAVERVVERYAGSRADRVIVATDNDAEGELIGWEALVWLKWQGVLDDPECARRMRFSAYTREDILRALEEALRGERIDPSLAYSALARTIADWLYGIPLTRQLSLCNDDIVSVGRVQTPTLKLVVERERERRKAQKKRKYHWVLQAETPIGELRTEEKFKNGRRARELASEIESIRVVEVRREHRSVRPPTPFNLTTLQRAAGEILRISPKRTLDLAQHLYEEGMITYPRTATNRYPSTFDHEKLLRKMRNAHPDAFRDFQRAGRRSEPVSGREYDGAHPPITPTGRRKYIRGKLTWLLYDLIVRRYLATLSENALIVKWRIVAEHPETGTKFVMEGTEVKRDGWYSVYPWKRPRERTMPDVSEGDELPANVNASRRREPLPRRYSQSRLVAKMKKLGLGTESTRAEIVKKLFDRGYVRRVGSGVAPTKRGERLVELLEDRVPELVSVELTRRIEREMEEISELPPKRARERLERVAREIRETVRRNSKKLKSVKVI